MTEDEAFDEFTRRLSDEWLIDVEESGLTLHGFEREPLEPPIRVNATPTSLLEHLRATADDARNAFPSAPPLIAALQLLLVHIEELVLTRRHDETELSLVGDALEWEA